MGLLLVRSEIIPLPNSVWPTDVIGYCTYSGYPKMQDYFVYILMLISGASGAVISWYLSNRFRKSGNYQRIIPGSLTATLVLAIVTTLLAFHAKLGTSKVVWLAYIFAALLPWFDGRWYQSSKETNPELSGSYTANRWHKWIYLGMSVVVVLWLFDTCIAFRKIDGMAEGWYLASIQAILNGDKPNTDFQINYGPLYIYSIYWWLKMTAFSLISQRWYLMACQILGTLSVLMAFSFARISIRGMTAGMVLILFGTVSGYYGNYGWPNTLRIGLPLLSLAVLWGGLFRRMSQPNMFISGILFAVSVHYSPDYSVATAVGLIVLIAMAMCDQKVEKTKILAWVAGVAVSYSILFILMFGFGAWPVKRVLSGESYMLKRLLGHGAWPLPPVPWYTEPSEIIRNIGQISWLVETWFAPVTCVLVLALLLAKGISNERRHILASLAAFTIVSHVPAMIRPLAQVSMSNVPAVVLLVLMVDSMQLRGKVLKGLAYIGLMCLLGLLFKSDGFTYRKGYVGGCESGKEAFREAQGLPRLNGIKLPNREAAFIERAVKIIRANTKSTDRILMADNYNQELLFIADRPPFLPYPQLLLVASSNDEKEFAQRIEVGLPKMVLINTFNADVPFVAGYPNIWNVIGRRYKLLAKINDTSFYVVKTNH